MSVINSSAVAEAGREDIAAGRSPISILDTAATLERDCLHCLSRYGDAKASNNKAAMESAARKVTSERYVNYCLAMLNSSCYLQLSREAGRISMLPERLPYSYMLTSA